MFLRQYYLNCLAHASYLIGDEQTGAAAVVDPQRDVDRYLDDAKRHGLSIGHVFLTHFHADFLAGHLELRDCAGARIYLGSRAEAEYGFQPMRDGDRLDLGAVRLQVLETPGHTVESICLLVFDLAHGAQKPHAVLTGDTLFIGDVGRPDLRASLGWSAEELGNMLYDSLHDKLLPLPDETLVYPAHGAGSLCGKQLSTETVSKIGDQRRYNYALQPMSRDAFVRMVTADQPEAPEYFTYDAVLNTRERSTLDQTLEHALIPLPLERVLEMQNAGAQVLDVRDPGPFSHAHLAGSVNIALGGQYATWAGTLLSHDQPIVLVAEPGREQEAAIRLGRIGFDHVAGYLVGGIQVLEGRPDLVEGWNRVDAPALADRLASAEPPLVLDVRTPKEWQAKSIDGALNIPLNRLRKHIHELPVGRKLAVHCAGGYRSAIAASLLQQAGWTDVEELAGGLASWEASKLPVVNSPARGQTAS